MLPDIIFMDNVEPMKHFPLRLTEDERAALERLRLKNSDRSLNDTIRRLITDADKKS